MKLKPAWVKTKDQFRIHTIRRAKSKILRRETGPGVHTGNQRWKSNEGEKSINKSE